jgi:hypothetical protein
MPATKVRCKRDGVPGLRINAESQYVHSYRNADGKRHRDRAGTIEDGWCMSIRGPRRSKRPGRTELARAALKSTRN